jgi:hypothetical protein
MLLVAMITTTKISGINDDDEGRRSISSMTEDR